MLKRLFNRRERPAPSVAPPAPLRWDAAQHSVRQSFALHLRGLALDDAAQQLRDGYGYAIDASPAIVLLADGDWLTANFSRTLVSRIGFNRVASQIARDADIWLIGYRLFGDEGMDVHYFRGGDHLGALAVSGEEIEIEPETAALFAPLADVTRIVPRRATQHPLDFHIALLNGLGIDHAALGWEEALALASSRDVAITL
ncbi:MAG: hypothetical protein KDD73_04435 [Anaerolineales bacterium]|nr:hypothetical protein [Anaerolineales bacterium]MCB9126745.1 hypothetical protein [Ardenticatenales bacterium]